MRKLPLARSIRAAVAALWSPLSRAGHAVARRVGGDGDADVDREWELAWSDGDGTRWRRGGETVDCFPFADGYVATATFESKDTTWQLTPGPLPLASAFASVATYRQHRVTPQVDPDGRPFVALDAKDDPTQVFTERETDARYVYLDGLRTLEEFPDFLDVGPDLEHAFRRMTPNRDRVLPSD